MENINQVEFQGMAKIARLSRECLVTEKLDGTQASVYITEDGDMFVGSKNRWITPAADNYGFAAWAEGNKTELLKLGPGRHFGEWWGKGIQRNYGLTERCWSLFNTIRWCRHNEEPQIISSVDSKNVKVQQRLPEIVGLVPIIWRGQFSTDSIDLALHCLRANGSAAVPGWMKPEGIVVYHVAANISFKKTIEKDEEPKSKS